MKAEYDPKNELITLHAENADEVAGLSKLIVEDVQISSYVSGGERVTLSSPVGAGLKQLNLTATEQKYLAYLLGMDALTPATVEMSNVHVKLLRELFLRKSYMPEPEGVRNVEIRKA